MKPAEYSAIIYLAAHPGQTIAEIADGMRRGIPRVLDTVRTLARMGLVTLPPGTGSDRVPVLTEEGKTVKPPKGHRFVKPEGNGIRPVTDGGMAVLRAILVARRPMSNKEIATATGIGLNNLAEVIDCLVADGFAVRGDPRPRYAPLVALTDKGQRMANGDLAITAPRVVLPCPEPATQAPQKKPEAVDVDSLVPPSFRLRGGIRHPPIPKPCERPKGFRAQRWLDITTPDASPLHDACARGLA